jgi:hypothetical protein
MTPVYPKIKFEVDFRALRMGNTLKIVLDLIGDEGEPASPQEASPDPLDDISMSVYTWDLGQPAHIATSNLDYRLDHGNLKDMSNER